jgi:low affinity Fe/Cu permease
MFVFMNYKKFLKPIGRITLIVMIGGLILGIVRLFQGSDDWGLINMSIFYIIFLFVFLPFLEKVNKHPKP